MKELFLKIGPSIIATNIAPMTTADESARRPYPAMIAASAFIIKKVLLGKASA